MGFVLPGDETQIDERPCEDTWPSVGEKFEVPGRSKTGIEFDAHIKVISTGAAEFKVRRVGGEEVSFEVGK